MSIAKLHYSLITESQSQSQTAQNHYRAPISPWAIMGNLIGKEKLGLSTALLKSARGDVVQPSWKSGVPASSKN
jgi:hypothetical protein